MTDPIRAALERLHQYAETFPEHDTDSIVARARAALSADGPAVPEGREPASVAGEPSDELVAQWIAEVWHEGTPVQVSASDLHLASKAAEWGARYGHQPTPPAEGEVAELVATLRRLAPQNPLGIADPTITRAADLLERLAGWKESALAVEREWDAHGIATMLGCQLGESQRACIQREVPRLLDQLRELEQRHPVPVPVSERLPGDALCWWYEPDEDDDGSGYGGNWTLLRIRGAVSCYTHWLPAHAIPLPGVEVQR